MRNSPEIIHDSANGYAYNLLEVCWSVSAAYSGARQRKRMVLAPTTVLSSAQSRAASLINELRSLHIGESPYQDAKRIADKYGTVRASSEWGQSDGNDGYFEGCQYQVVVQRPWVSRMLFRFPLSKWPGLRYWNGTADIKIKRGKVSGYSFSAVFRTKEGQWRGVAAEETTLLDGRAVEAKVSDSYRVARNDLMSTI